MLRRFIDSLSRAVALEMESMRRRLGPYEIPIVSGQAGHAMKPPCASSILFHLTQPSDRLVPGGEYNLVTESGDGILESVVSTYEDQVSLVSPRRLDLTSGVAALAVCPWVPLRAPQEHTPGARRTFMPARPCHCLGRFPPLLHRR